MKPIWVNYPGGAYVELAYGIRAAVALDKEAGRFRISFAGVTTPVTFPDKFHAKLGAIRLANDIVSALLLAMLELEDGEDHDKGSGGIPV